MNYDKIKFIELGKYRITAKIFGKVITYVMKCPSCRSETTFFRRKGVLKIKCDSCSYDLIVTMGEWISQAVNPYKVERDIKDFFIRVLEDG